MSGAIFEIPQRVAAELAATIPSQLPAHSEELRANPNAIQDLLVRRIGAFAAKNCSDAPPQLSAVHIDPDGLWALERTIVGGRIVTEWRKGLTEGEGVETRFRGALIGNEAERYVRDEPPTYADYFRGTQFDINGALSGVASRIEHLPSGSWLRPFIDRFDQLLTTNRHSTATDTYTALSNSSLVPTTFDLIRLVNSSPLKTPTDQNPEQTRRLTPDERVAAAHDLTYLIGSRASMHLHTFYRATRIDLLEGYIDRRTAQDNKELYVFHQTNKDVWGNVYPHVSPEDLTQGSALRLRCIAHQHKRSSNENLPLPTDLELLAHAIINLAAERGLFGPASNVQERLREL